jgi:purine nucleoside permease
MARTGVPMYMAPPPIKLTPAAEAGRVDGRRVRVYMTHGADFGRWTRDARAIGEVYDDAEGVPTVDVAKERDWYRRDIDGLTAHAWPAFLVMVED